MDNIKLFVCCHQPFAVPEHPLLQPIQVGAALAQEHFPNFLHDDEGETISAKNRSYCELTAQYWAWKNADADYFGFFHYRRYLCPDTDAKLPYRVEADPSQALLDRLAFDRLGELIPGYDLIAPMSEDMHIPVRKHYAGAPHHRKQDLDLIEQILQERHPEMTQAVQKYLSGSVCYFGNIYIMKRPVFHAYCAWLFPLLEEFDRRADLTGRSPQELRVDGYLAERLFGVWYEFRKQELQTLELPRVHFEPDAAQRRKKRILNALLPPGSRMRAAVKTLFKS